MVILIRDRHVVKIGNCLLQMQGHSFTSVGISASQDEMVEVKSLKQ